jgi:peroxiredoxin
MKSIWYQLVIIILAAFNVLLLYQNHQLKAGGAPPLARPELYAGQLQIPPVPVIDRDNSVVSLSDLVGQSEFTVLVFFSPSDCPPCFSEKDLWGQIPKRCGIPVFGIASNPDPRELWQWVGNTGIPIEVYLDSSLIVESMMDFARTPLKALVDSTGTILWADPPRLEPAERESFWRDLSNAME